MSDTLFHKLYAPIKRLAPGFISRPIRAFITAFATPVRFSIIKGHFISSFKEKAVDRKGNPLPWYTYACIDFLKFRDFKNMKIMEFGAGQSTIWWASHAAHVVSFEGNEAWFNYIKNKMPANVDLYHASEDNATACLSDVNRVLAEKKYPKFDIIIIDGLWRFELIQVAKDYLSSDGAIICDNSEGYGFYEGFQNNPEFKKVDFYGYAPGCIMQSCTTIYFEDNCKLFDPGIKTYEIEKF